MVSCAHHHAEEAPLGPGRALLCDGHQPCPLGWDIRYHQPPWTGFWKQDGRGGLGSPTSPQRPEAGSPIFIWKLLKECSLMYFIWSINFMAKSARALMWVLPTLS